MSDIFDQLISAREKRKVVLCVVVGTRGSTPRKTGAKMLVYENGDIFGTIGGGDLERAVISNALKQLSKGTPALFRHDLLHQHSMCCGGSVDIYIEPVMKKKRLYIFGSGHTGVALAALSAKLDFEIVVVDDRKEYIDQCTTEGVNKLCMPFEQALAALPFDDQTYSCIMTYSHPIDRDILAFCIRQPHAYLGMIGSLRKVEMTRKIFLDGGIATKEQLDNVDMPMGVDISAESPEEIAVSILARLISIKNKKTA